MKILSAADGQRMKILNNELSDWFRALRKQKTEMEIRFLSDESRGLEYHDENVRVDRCGLAVSENSFNHRKP